MSLIDSVSGLPLKDALNLMNQVVRDLQIHRYVAVAAVTCMLYDILLTIKQESSLIWSAPWSCGKVLYFLVRYPVAIEEILWLVYLVDLDAPESFCKFEAYFGIWASLIFLIPLQIVVVLRIIAIWSKKRLVVLILWSCLITTDVVALVTIARITHIFKYTVNDLFRPILGCQSGFMTLNPMTTVPAWAGIIAFDTVLFVLTLVKAVRSCKTGQTRLLSVLIRDGFAYYCIMLALAVSNTVFLSAMPLERSGLNSLLTPALRCSYSIIGSRIILNLRSASSTRIELGSRQQNIRMSELSWLSSWRGQAETCVETTVNVGECIPTRHQRSGKLIATSLQEGPGVDSRLIV